MAKPARQWITRAAMGIAIGAAIGVAIGWWLWPVTYTNTAPDALRGDYHDEYILMIATAYETERDQEEARERLALLAPEEPPAPVIELAERLIEEGGSEDDIVRLARLAEALGATAPALMPYLRS